MGGIGRTSPGFFISEVYAHIHRNETSSIIFNLEVIFIKIGFIGAGKVGFSLGKYFKVNNKNVLGYFSKNPQSAKSASVFTKTRHFAAIEQLVYECDTIFITTSDDEISNIWNVIKELPIKNKIICHTSGSLSSEVFLDIKHCGAFGYSVHPMFPISDKYKSHEALKEAFFTIEGSNEKIQEVSNLITSIGNKVKIIKKENKSLYHAASVTASNLYIALMSIGVEYLKNCDFSEEEAIAALYPLCNSNLQNIKNKGLEQALTGPVERGDKATIDGHLKAIPKEDIILYKHLSSILLQLAKKKNNERSYQQLDGILGGK